MLKLRKILLYDFIYYTFIILIILLTAIRLSLPKRSKISLEIKSIVGVIENYHQTDDDVKLLLSIDKKEKLLVYYHLSEKDQKFDLGDKILIQGVTQEPKKNTVPNQLNYKMYLQHKNIFYVVQATNIQILNKNKNLFYRLKTFMKQRLRINPYLQVFVLGDNENISKEAISSFRYNGISHLFAVSGMHINLLSSIIIRMLKRLKLAEKSYTITSIFLLIYAAFVGFSPSVLRSLLFFVLFSINKVYYLHIKSINLYIIVLGISLIINPSFIFDVGFLYSYIISLSLLLSTNYLNNKSYIISLLKTSIISFLVSFPISLYNYYQINAMGIIYNLIYVPFVSIVVFPMSLLTTIIPILNPIYTILTTILEKTSIYLTNIKILNFVFPRMPFWFYLLYYVMIVLVLIGLNYKWKKLFFPMIICLIIHYTYPYINQKSYVTTIDVGQGDSTLIHSNNYAILVDTGGKNSYKYSDFLSLNTTIPLLKSLGIRKLHYLILTHGDFDHMGEAINLVNNFKVEKVIFNCGSYNDLEQELIKVLDKKKIKYYSCIKELDIDNNKLYFLQTKEYDNENDNSNVIYTELNGYKFMFMGDASITKEKEILDKYNLQDIDVLKVGHHGSRTSSSKEFVDEINPKYSIISVGKNNRYGHPNKEVLEIVKESKIYRTDQDGSVMFKIKNNKLKIETCEP